MQIVKDIIKKETINMKNFLKILFHDLKFKFSHLIFEGSVGSVMLIIVLNFSYNYFGKRCPQQQGNMQ